MYLKQLFLLILSSVLILPGTIFSQTESNLNANLGANLVSRHIWRGLAIGGTNTSPAGPHAQPFVLIKYHPHESGTASIGFLGTYGLNNRYSESDFLINYSLSTPAGTFKAQIFDYHYPYTGINFTNVKNDGSGAHTLEASLNYTLPGQHPLSIFVSRNFHNVIEDDNTFYASLSYPVELEQTQLKIFVGGAAGPSQWHVVSNENFTVTNLGVSASKSLSITEEFSLPVSATWTYNPHLEISYIALGISI